MKTEGIVTELDFEEQIFTLLNRDYISAALRDYPDQELRSFLVIGPGSACLDTVQTPVVIERLLQGSSRRDFETQGVEYDRSV